MTTIKESFEKILLDYPAAKLIKAPQVSSFIKSDFPQMLRVKAHIGDGYKITGSVGKGNWANVPWICIFDRSISESAQSGYYIVYLFHAEMKGVYLSLNQGWTQYENLSDNPQGEIIEVVDHFRGLIDISSYRDKTIVLSKTKQRLARGYERGQICGKFYPKDAIPADEVLVSDLQDMLRLYGELKLKVGPLYIQDRLEKVFRLKEDATDQTFQHEILYSKPRITPPGPQPPKKKGRGSLVNRFPRDPRVAKQRLVAMQYQCEVDKAHPSFLCMATNQNYAEAHHLVPVYCQADFKWDLDVEENILALCPLCHRKFHHAKLSDRKPLLERFYNDRMPGLRARGINLKLNRLVDYYLTKSFMASEESSDDAN